MKKPIEKFIFPPISFLKYILVQKNKGIDSEKMPNFCFKTLFTLLILILLSLLVRSYFKNAELFYHTTFELKISSDKSDKFQLFYDTGKGFNETESVKAAYTPLKDNPVKFIVPGVRYKAVRIDLGSKKGALIKIDRLTITHHNVVKTIDADQLIQLFTPNEHLLRDTASGDLLFTVLGNDPFLYSTQNFNNSINQVVNLSKFILPAFIVLLTLCLMFFYLFISQLFAKVLQNCKLFLVTFQSHFTGNLKYFRLSFITLICFVLMAAVALLFIMIISGDTVAVFRNTEVITFFNTFKILFGTIYLITFGYLAIDLLALHFWFNRDSTFFPIHSAAFSTIVLMFYVYIRSLINQLSGCIIPVGTLDFALLYLTVLFLSYLKNKKIILYTECKQNAKWYLVLLSMLYLYVFTFAIRELPRITLISTDPAVHSFITNQIINFGTVFYNHQSYWGDTGFNYPTGFHVLSFIWSKITCLDAVNIVSIQVLIQYVFAVLLLWEVSITTYDNKRHNYLLITLASLVVYVVLIRFMPYSYEAEHFHLEGTGRMASMFGYSILLSYFIQSGKKNKTIKNLDLPLEAFCIFGIAFFLLTINPINVVLAAFSGGLGLLLVIIRQRSVISSKGFFIVLPLIILITLSIPDIYNEITTACQSGNSFNDTSDVITGSVKLTATSVVKCALLSLNYSSLANAVHIAFNASGQYGKFLFILIAILYIPLIIDIAGRLKKNHLKNYSYAAVIFPFAIILVVLLFGVLIKIIEYHELIRDYYLLNYYFSYSICQAVLLWIAYLLFRQVSNFKSIKAVIIVLLSVLILNLVVNDGRQFVYRKNIPGGHISKTDIVVVDFIKKHFMEYIKTNRDITCYDVPKILFPLGYYEKFSAQENWLFAFAPENYLAMSGSYPVAFYFTKNSSVFTGLRSNTFDVYKANIHDYFNYDFIKAQNIKYLFISSSYGRQLEQNDGHNEISISQINEIFRNTKVLKKKGSSYFIELF